jgi:hypothetical protein
MREINVLFLIIHDVYTPLKIKLIMNTLMALFITFLCTLVIATVRIVVVSIIVS